MDVHENGKASRRSQHTPTMVTVVTMDSGDVGPEGPLFLSFVITICLTHLFGTGFFHAK